MEKLREQFKSEIGMDAMSNPKTYVLWLELYIQTELN
jgi:hypothetical protein